MAIWFLTLGALGLRGILGAPGVLAALSPTHALAFFAAHPTIAFFSLGSVVLAVTGVEALYADMGHSAADRCAWPVPSWSCRP
jgi:KUP system potassium uptake protein